MVASSVRANSRRDDHVPPRGPRDLARRAWRNLPVAVLIAVLLACGLLAATSLLPARYQSEALLFVAPTGSHASAEIGNDASARNALIEQEVSLLKSPAVLTRIAEEFRRRSPVEAAQVAAEPGLRDIARDLRIQRRDNSFMIEFRASGPTPRTAQAMLEAAVETYQFGQFDRRVAAVSSQPSPPLAAPRPDEAFVAATKTLARLEDERGKLLAETPPPIRPNLAQAEAQVDLARVRADAAALREFIRSDVSAPDVARLRASMALDRLGSVGDDLTREVTEYEAASEAGSNGKEAELRLRKYRVLTQASAALADCDRRIAQLSTRMPSAAATTPAPSSSVAEQLKELDAKIRAQLEFVGRSTSAPARPVESSPTGQSRPAVDVRIVSNPSIGVPPAWRQPWFLASVAGAGGLAAGLAYLLFATLSSNAVIDPRDAAALAAAPVIATLPHVKDTELRRMPPGERHPANLLIEAPGSRFSDAIRAMLKGLEVPGKGGAGACLAVAATQAGEGATTVSLAVARCAAASGLRVLLVDSDFSHAGVTHAMGIEPAAGIETIISGDRPLADFVVEDDASSLHLLPSAPGPANRGALSLAQLTSLSGALEHARKAYDLVILDCEPPNKKARTRAMFRLADAVVIVVARNSSKRALVRLLGRRIQQNGGTLSGVVFNYAQAAAQSDTDSTSKRRSQSRTLSFSSQPFAQDEIPRFH